MDGPPPRLFDMLQYFETILPSRDAITVMRMRAVCKFVGSALNSKSPLLVQSLKILLFIPTYVALAGLVILW